MPNAHAILYLASHMELLLTSLLSAASEHFGRAHAVLHRPPSHEPLPQSVALYTLCTPPSATPAIRRSLAADLKVGRRIGGRRLRLPIVEGQIRRLGHQLLFPVKVRLEPASGGMESNGSTTRLEAMSGTASTTYDSQRRKKLAARDKQCRALRPCSSLPHSLPFAKPLGLRLTFRSAALCKP